MADQKMIRLSQAARKLNVGITTITEELVKKGFQVDPNPNSKITSEQYSMLEKEFEDSIVAKREASSLNIGSSHSSSVAGQDKKGHQEEEDLFVPEKSEKKPEPAKEGAKTENKAGSSAKKEEEPEKISTRLPGLKVVDKIDLSPKKKPEPKKEEPVVEAKKEPQPEAEKKIETPKPEVKAAEAEEKPVVKTPEEKPKVEEKEPEKVIAKEKPVTPEEKKEEKPPIEKKAEPVIKQEHKPEKVVAEEPVTAEEIEAPTSETIKAKAESLQGLKVLGKIELPVNKPKKKGGKKEAEAPAGNQAKPAGTGNNQSSGTNQDRQDAGNRKRKRVKVSKGSRIDPAVVDKSKDKNQPKKKEKDKGRKKKEEISEKEINKGYQETLSKLSAGKGGKSNRSKYKREKRSQVAAAEEERMQREIAGQSILKVAEFISTNELASLMDVSVNEIISKCMGLGMFISINQRLDAETIELVAEEFGFSVDFTSAEEEMDTAIPEVEDKAEDLLDRAPIVTIMGHVDHGKTSLLDYIRDAKVAEGEAGGITQHIGAYDVTTESGRRIAFLDTPGHEAFTAMRARGAKLTDVAIIVVAADDSVMPQTVEAINHAQVAGVPIVIAINKVDKPTANPNKIKEELANMNILVEDWGGKYQSYEISAKTGQGIDDLLEGVILESDVLELKANPNKNAIGTVVEASLDKGRGYVATILVQEGTMRVQDVVLAGHHYGRVKAMFDHRGNKLKEAGPATPVQLLGLNGAPQAGDKLNVMESEREAREIATKREQIVREQSIRATRRTTLSDIGKRIAIGNFQQLNVILRGDVDGSVEALSDSLLKLSTEEVEVNIIQKAVGPISESDILLASASDAVVIGFQVRPTTSAKRLAEKEEVEVRLYSVIYDAINDVKQAMEGLLAPELEEKIVGNAEVREVFKITKVGTVAGCMVTDGYIKRNGKIRVVRDGIVIYGGESGGEIGALKRFKDDVNEVKQNFECGISIRDYNDLKVGDVIESFEINEVKRTLSK